MPRLGCRNVGFTITQYGEGYLAKSHMGAEWTGTEFEDCSFEVTVNGRTDKPVAAGIVLTNCIVNPAKPSGNLRLGKRSRVEYSRFVEDLELEAGSHISHSQVDGDLLLAERCVASEVTVAGNIVISGPDVTVTIASKHPEDVSRIVMTRHASLRAHVDLQSGAVIVIDDPESAATHVFSGDTDFIAHSAGDPLSLGLAELKLKVARSRDRSDPLWVSAANDGAWNHIINYVEPLSAKPDTIPDEVTGVALLISPNP